MLTTSLNHLQLLFVWNINDLQNRNNDSVRLIISYCVFKHAVSDNVVMWKLNLLCNFSFLHIGALTLHASSCSKLCRLWAALCDRPSAWMTSERWRGMWSSLLMTWQDETSFRPSGQVSAPQYNKMSLCFIIFHVSIFKCKNRFCSCETSNIQRVYVQLSETARRRSGYIVYVGRFFDLMGLWKDLGLFILIEVFLWSIFIQFFILFDVLIDYNQDVRLPVNAASVGVSVTSKL